MSIAGVRAGRELVALMTDFIQSLEESDWALESACEGWRVQDVIAHMAYVFNQVTDPTLPAPENPSGLAERFNDLVVETMADWHHERTAEYYVTQSENALGVLEALQQPRHDDKKITMNELGTYPLRALSNVITFDHLVHLTSDLVKPYGPVTYPVPDIDRFIDPAIDWMIMGLPQMCEDALLPALNRPIGLVLTGIDSRNFVIARNANGDGVRVEETEALPADFASSEKSDFLRWGTKRESWRPRVSITGDSTAVANVLDRIDIV